MALRNRFGWSISRESMFDTCRRRYYFHYYLSWNGWNASAPAIAQEAFKLKRLISLPLWRGQLVHYVASKVLQSLRKKRRIPDARDVVRYTLERFDRQLAFSRSRRYLTEPKKKGGKLNIDWLALFEHEYRRPLDPGRIERAREECVRAVEGLLRSPILHHAAETDEGEWVIEDLDHAEFSQNFTFDGVTVYIKTDFLFREPDGVLCIVDWKTTREPGPTGGDARGEPDAAVQLGVYGYYAARVLGVPADKIRLYEVNLLHGGSVTEHAVDEEMLGRSREHIARGIAKLSSVIAGSDRQRNEPKPADHFPAIDNGKCGSCNFFRICKDEHGPFARRGPARIHADHIRRPG
jgi:hypothetical protein